MHVSVGVQSMYGICSFVSLVEEHHHGLYPVRHILAVWGMNESLVTSSELNGVRSHQFDGIPTPTVRIFKSGKNL